MGKKYVTTETNLVFKKGIKLKYNGVNYYIELAGIKNLTWFNDQSINILLKNGYIKEVEPKEFTESDMIEFGEYTQDTTRYACDCMVGWLNQRK